MARAHTPSTQDRGRSVVWGLSSKLVSATGRLKSNHGEVGGVRSCLSATVLA